MTIPLYPIYFYLDKGQQLKERVDTLFKNATTESLKKVEEVLQEILSEKQIMTLNSKNSIKLRLGKVHNRVHEMIDRKRVNEADLSFITEQFKAIEAVFNRRFPNQQEVQAGLELDTLQDPTQKKINEETIIPELEKHLFDICFSGNEKEFMDLIANGLYPNTWLSAELLEKIQPDCGKDYPNGLSLLETTICWNINLGRLLIYAGANEHNPFIDRLESFGDRIKQFRIIRDMALKLMGREKALSLLPELSRMMEKNPKVELELIAEYAEITLDEIARDPSLQKALLARCLELEKVIL